LSQQTSSTPDARRFNQGAAASLEPYLDSTLLANGQINLISLDAITERLGSRWPMRRELVYDYTERMLEQHIGDAGHFVRVSETDFLVVLPGVQKFAAQARCLRYLREVLTYFLGRALPADLTVREVTRITQDGLEAVLLDPAQVQAAAERETAKEIEREGPTGRVDRWTPFVASDGRTVRVSCRLEPVYELKHYSQIGHRLARHVLRMNTEDPLTPAELQNLSRTDIEKIDLATIARGLDRLRAEAGGQRDLSLIIPVSYITLSHLHGRASLAELFEEAKAFVRTGVICEVCDIEGVPQAALMTATSLIRPYCMFASGGLSAAPDHGVGNLRDARLRAVSFEAPEAIVSDAEFFGWAKRSIRAAKQVARSVMIYRIASLRHAGIAGLLGASHAGLRTAPLD
jgi:hypothetical protein